MTARQLLAEAQVRVRGLSLMVDVVNACSFRCPSCPVGQATTRKGMMDLATFDRVMDRVQSQVKVRYVLLYSFSEPFLHPHAYTFVRSVKDRGIKRCMISTNLSQPTDRVRAALDAGLDELRISFSGFDQGEYFHRGRDMQEFRRLAGELSRLVPFYPDCRIALIWHKYRTNAYEEPTVRQFAKDMGFDLIVERAFFIPWEKVVRHEYTAHDLALIDHLLVKPWAARALNGTRQEFCYYQSKQLVIDAQGQTYLCRHVFDDEFITGDIMRDSIWDIRRAALSHSFCPSCKDHRLNKYTEQS